MIRRRELENLNNFSLKIRPELKIANFLIAILRIFCDSWFNLHKTLDFNRNNLYTKFCFSELLTLRDKKVRVFSKSIEKTPFRRVAQKRYNLAPGVSNHTFFDSSCSYSKNLKNSFFLIIKT